ncbi:MAG: YqcC family protein [Marinospirillum sp.]|uniref:YqcC family protein n=1 Tax=Marinospirillum sp. TaxID=2183934 RepID=UPI0019FC1F6E|nr:YqcC family protein [Marinospirillum sp.]MBE0507886.1 YqcC family protein [Marinospirillum sp.]
MHNNHSKNHPILRRLINLLIVRMDNAGLWQQPCPPADAFNGNTPFCMDTMTIEQWLRYVFVPRLNAIIDSGQPLPSECSITPQLNMHLPDIKKASITEVTLAIDLLLTEKQLPPLRLLKGI